MKNDIVILDKFDREVRIGSWVSFKYVNDLHAGVVVDFTKSGSPKIIEFFGLRGELRGEDHKEFNYMCPIVIHTPTILIEPIVNFEDYLNNWSENHLEEWNEKIKGYKEWEKSNKRDLRGVDRAF